MTDETASPQQPPPVAPRWQPLGAIDRRMLGVLAEKAKTTPDGYPMSVSAICSGCNQKSNRFPLMQLGPEDVEESLERLRQMGAVAMIEGYGRVTKYRHYLYEWLGVEKVELSVMTELLLRVRRPKGSARPGLTHGPHSRPAGPADVAGVAEGQGTGHSAHARGTRPRRYSCPLRATGVGAPQSRVCPRPGGSSGVEDTAAVRAVGSARCSRRPLAERCLLPGLDAPAEAESLRRQLEELRGQVAHLRSEMQDLSLAQERIREELRGLKDALGG